MIGFNWPNERRCPTSSASALCESFDAFGNAACKPALRIDQRPASNLDHAKMRQAHDSHREISIEPWSGFDADSARSLVSIRRPFTVSASAFRHMIRAGSATIIVTRSTGSNNKTYYSTQDHLGSANVITDETAAVVTSESFAAYGKRRNATTWDGGLSAADWTAISQTTRRGFTGHTMLDNFGGTAASFIHMNGRVYDPEIGRFLSVDPVIQTIEASQALNAYAYVWNNPLKYTDPTGMFLKKLFKKIGRFLKKHWKAIVAVVAAAITYGAVVKWIAHAAGKAAAASMNSLVGLTGSNIVSGFAYTSAYTAAAASWTTAAIAGAASGFVAGAITGGVRGAVIGGLSGFMFGGIAGHYRGTWTLGRAAASGVAGGVTSEMSGGSFADGFKSGFGISVLQWGAYRMRQAEIASSRGNPLNDSGVSRGWIGDEADPEKLAGARSVFGSRALGMVLAPFGPQGEQGTFFGVGYSPGGAIDSLLESFAGPHDWMLRNYSAFDGSVRNMGFWGRLALNAQAVVTLVPAAGIVGAQVSPALAFISRDR